MVYDIDNINNKDITSKTDIANDIAETISKYKVHNQRVLWSRIDRKYHSLRSQFATIENKREKCLA